MVSIHEILSHYQLPLTIIARQEQGEASERKQGSKEGARQGSPKVGGLRYSATGFTRSNHTSSSHTSVRRSNRDVKRVCKRIYSMGGAIGTLLGGGR